MRYANHAGVHRYPHHLRRAKIEEPDFIWVVGRGFDPSLGVPLARLHSESSTGIAVLDDSFSRPVARPLARPRIASGETVPGDTHWEPWIESSTLFRKQVLSFPIGMQVTVDTTTAGFTETPCYFAWLAGTLWDKSNVEFFPVPFTHLDREQTGQFRFRLWMPQLAMVLGARFRTANNRFEDEFINYAREHGIHVCWIGIQHALSKSEICPNAQTPECEIPE